MENDRNTGAEFILGTGRFLAQRTVEVTLADGTTRQLRGANVIVSTGTRAALEAIPGLAEAQPLILNEMMVVSTNRNGGLTAAETAQIMVDVNNLLSTGATALIRTAGAAAFAVQTAARLSRDPLPELIARTAAIPPTRRRRVRVILPLRAHGPPARALPRRAPANLGGPAPAPSAVVAFASGPPCRPVSPVRPSAPNPRTSLTPV